MITPQLFDESALGRRAPFIVLGGPGAGKTRLVLDLARHWALAERTAVVVLTSNRASADQLRGEVHGELLRSSPELVLGKPLVRTTHSYAFALLEAQARAFGNPPPRLIPAAEQDATLRELADEQSSRWPVSLRAALGSAEFTAQLRSVFQRAAQHGHGPDGLIALGKERGRPEWVAAGRTWREYEQVMTLRNAVGMADPTGSPGALDAAELLTAALDAAADDPELLLQPLGGPGSRFVVLVDDAQHFDPQAARLVRLAAARADLAVLTADPDQSVFWFQGAEAGFGLWRRAEHIRLGASQRLSSSVAALAEAVAPRESAPLTTAREAVGEAGVRLYPTMAAQAEGVVEALCRARAKDGTPWSRMAVLVRSVPALAPSLTRAAALAGVPLRTSGTVGPLASNATVWALLTLLKAVAAGGMEPSVVLGLLTSPLAGASIAEARGLRRTLRADEPERPSLELLAELVLGEREEVPEPVLRLRRVWRAASAAHAQARTVEDVLWEAWSASELERRWGADDAAEPDFVAVNTLFDVARAHPAQAPGGFAERIERERLPAPGRGDGGAEAVALLSAHAAAGREWDVVVVCGVQEGLWPSLGESGSLLGVDDLAAALEGVEAGAKLDGRKQMLAQERRLLYLACSRARDQLWVTAVEGEGEMVPSRFLARFLPFGEPSAPSAPQTDDASPPEPRTPEPASAWSSSGVVAELRAIACGDDDDDGERASRAAAALAALARVGVIGAHPRSWHGLAAPSTSEALAKDGVVTLSPSRVEQLLVCPLRWLFERVVPSGPSEAAAVGTAVHLLASSSGRFSEEELRQALDEATARADERSARPTWAARRRQGQLEQLLTTFVAWRDASRGELTEVGVEIPVELSLPGGEDELEVRLKGRVDRLEKNADGALVIVDLKTAKAPRSVAAVREDAQLACYQLVVGAAREEPMAGGRLVFLGAARKETGAAERDQEALAEEDVAQWRDAIRTAGASANGPEFQAVLNPGCGNCPGRRSCPAMRSVAG